MRNWIIMLGAVLWLGTLSPEIFVDSTAGCIFDENGDELSKEEAQVFMEAYFYRDKNNSEASPTLKFKIGVMELFDGN